MFPFYNAILIICSLEGVLYIGTIINEGAGRKCVREHLSFVSQFVASESTLTNWDVSPHRKEKRGKVKYSNNNVVTPRTEVI